jgi:hypothetical protein
MTTCDYCGVEVAVPAGVLDNVYLQIVSCQHCTKGDLGMSEDEKVCVAIAAE